MFKRSRKALRWHNGPIPLSTQSRWSDKQLASARRGIDNFLADVDSAKRQTTKEKSRALVSGLDIVERRFVKYREKLLAPNIQVETTHGGRVVKVERTNTGVEQNFRACRRHARRLRGDKNVEGIVQREGVGLLLLQNAVSYPDHKYMM